jgi:hypothetical protein
MRDQVLPPSTVDPGRVAFGLRLDALALERRAEPASIAGA